MHASPVVLLASFLFLNGCQLVANAASLTEHEQKSVSNNSSSIILAQQGGVDVDESLGAESAVLQQQSTDLNALIYERLVLPLKNGIFFDVTVGKPRAIANSILQDKDQQRAQRLSPEQNDGFGGQNSLRFRTQLRQCYGVCDGEHVVVFPVQITLKNKALSDILEMMSEIGVPTENSARDEECSLGKCIGLFVNSNKSPEYDPKKDWIPQGLWKISSEHSLSDDLRLYEKNQTMPRIVLLDKNGSTIIDERLGEGGSTYGLSLYQHIAGDQGLGNYVGSIYPGTIFGEGAPGIRILSGAQYYVAVNLGNQPLSDVGRIDVIYGY